MAKAIAPGLEQAGEACTASPARLVRLTCHSATTCAHAHTGAWCHAVARASSLGACLQAACRADESGVRRPMPHLQASMAFKVEGQDVRERPFNFASTAHRETNEVLRLYREVLSVVFRELSNAVRIVF